MNTQMMKIKIRDGHVIVPKGWVILAGLDPKECDHVGVVEVRNGARYNTPHFVFFSTRPLEDFQDEDYERVNEECIKAFPDFEKILGAQVEPKIDKDNNILNREEFLDAPNVGYFPILDSGLDPDRYPSGAMVIRDRAYEK